jgi:hypothetical protein
MNTPPSFKWIIPFIFILALFAAGAGLFWMDKGQTYPLTTYRGEQVMINAHGLYYWDTVSMTSQMQGNDIVTLMIGLPLLVISFWLTQRGSLRGRFLLTGTLGYFLYSYMSMCFGTAYNNLFLVYVALFSLSLFAFILSMMSFDMKTLTQHFSERLPRRAFAAMFILIGAFLSLAWLGRIIPPLMQNGSPPLENVTSLFIQAMDLGMIVPLCFLSAVFLLRRNPFGYLLASISVMKFLTMGMAVSVMGINMVRAGVPASPVDTWAQMVNKDDKKVNERNGRQ